MLTYSAKYMRKQLLYAGFVLVCANAFAQVPPTPQPLTPQDSVLNDSVFFNDKLEEIIVVGYGSRKAGAITGSVAQIKASDIVRTPAQSAIQAIQGKAAGINIVTNDEPGGAPSIRIRGLGTIVGGRDPLYVIDGIETSGINGISPNDIATIDILKDASSLAIYGQKGANGVIIITTKKGKAGEFKVTYDAYYGQKFIQRKVEMADSYKYAYYNNTALGDAGYFNFNQPYNTNWLDEITDTGQVISNSVSISGATEKSNFHLGVTNYKEKGILSGSEFERTNVISNNTYKLFEDRLKITSFVNMSMDHTTSKPLSAFTNAYKQSPIMPVRYENGRYGAPLLNENGINDMTGDRYNNVANPVAQLENYNSQSKGTTIIAAINAELKLTDWLKFSSNFGATANWSKSYSFTPTLNNYLATNPTATRADYIAQNPNNTIFNSLTQSKSSNYRYNWDNYVTFNKQFDKHNITVTAGFSKTSFGIGDYLSGTRNNVPEQPNYWSLDFSSYNTPTQPNQVVNNSTSTPLVSLAAFGRAEYSYDDKYLLTAIVRREGISYFQDGNRYAVFPSISAGWVVTNEDFMKDVKLLNNLKVRGGYGEVGNGYTGMPLNQTTFLAGSNYPFGVNPQSNPGYRSDVLIDKNLSWETMKELDFGFDFAVLESRLTGTFDYYSRATEDALLPVTLPYVLSPERTFLNTGKVTNKGVELTMKWQDKIGDSFTYWVGGNISHNKNELAEVNSPFFANLTGGGLGNGAYTKDVIVGQPLGSFSVYQVTGFNSDGYFSYSNQRVVAGSYLPTYTYGINIGATYKNFDISADAYGVGGNKIYNGKKAQRFGGENVEASVLNNFWTPSNPNAQNPRPSNDVPVASTYYIENGSFIRINNITLGYTLPEFFKGIDKLRVYATAVNPFLFTKYSGFSPEVVGGGNADPLGSAGIELDAYPTNKSFLFGLNVSF